MTAPDTEDEPRTGTAPPISDFSPWKVGQPDDGIVWLYKSAVDGHWRIIKDEDHALQEATNYPVGELVEYEEMGDWEDAEQGELRAIFVPPAEDTVECDDLVETHHTDGVCAVCNERFNAVKEIVTPSGHLQLCSVCSGLVREGLENGE